MKMVTAMLTCTIMVSMVVLVWLADAQAQSPRALTLDTLEQLLEDAGRVVEPDWKDGSLQSPDGRLASITSLVFLLPVTPETVANARMQEEFWVAYDPPAPSALLAALRCRGSNGAEKQLCLTQRRYIQRLLCMVSGDRATGVVQYEAKTVVRLKATFTCEFVAGEWVVRAFELPVRGIQLTRVGPTEWKITKRDEASTRKGSPSFPETN